MIYFIISIIMLMSNRATVDPCIPFDQWIGLPRFDYQVDSNGNWNFPADAKLTQTINFPVGGMWIYFSDSEQERYTILFRDFETDGKTYGNHDICVYKG